MTIPNSAWEEDLHKYICFTCLYPGCSECGHSMPEWRKQPYIQNKMLERGKSWMCPQCRRWQDIDLFTVQIALLVTKPSNCQARCNEQNLCVSNYMQVPMEQRCYSFFQCLQSLPSISLLLLPRISSKMLSLQKVLLLPYIVWPSCYHHYYYDCYYYYNYYHYLLFVVCCFLFVLDRKQESKQAVNTKSKIDFLTIELLN